jgi:acetyltransferase-like isoleucine patch superfamily enzyme
MRIDRWEDPLSSVLLSENGEGSPVGPTALGGSEPIAPREPKRGFLRDARLAARRAMMTTLRLYYVRGLGMDIDPSAWFSLKVQFDRTHPRGVHIGADSYIAFGAVILTHDMTRGIYADTRIGERCFVGAHALILPGITIGEGSIVGAGSVVTRDVPSGTIVAGNPARVVREGIRTYRFGCLWDWEADDANIPRKPWRSPGST